MVAKLAALTLLPLLLVGGAVANAQIVLVQVHDEDTQLTLPVPLALLQFALAFAPERFRRVEAPEFAPYVEDAERLLAALADLPDVVLVEVEERAEHVRVAKHGDLLQVRVHEGDSEHVTANVPIASLRGMLAAWDVDAGAFRTPRLLAALRAAPAGRLVHVLDGDEEVSIRVW